jgi:hypothetical protein
MLYHACLCWRGHVNDVSGMYSVAAFPAFYALLVLWLRRRDTARRVTRGNRFDAGAKRIALYVCALYVAFFVVNYYFWNVEEWYTNARRDAFMGVVCITALVANVHVALTSPKTTSTTATAAASKRGVDAKVFTYVIVGVLFFCAFIAHTLDRLKIACYPHSVYQVGSITQVVSFNHFLPCFVFAFKYSLLFLPSFLTLLYQGHALWHVVSAFCLWMLYAVFRSDGAGGGGARGGSSGGLLAQVGGIKMYAD